jgi:hypothetical protein
LPFIRAFREFITLAHHPEVCTIGIQQFCERLGNIGPFPRRPDGVSSQREHSSNHRAPGALGYHFARIYANDSHHQDHHPADGDDEDPIVCRPEAA